MSSASASFDPFAGGGIETTAPATGPQQEIWVAVELGGIEASLAYNESVSLLLEGSFDEAVLASAVTELSHRHQALRTTLTNDGATLCVDAESRARLDVVDLSSSPKEEREQRHARLRELAVAEPFDLAHGPLFRAQLIRLGAQSAELILTAHHVVCDGYSIGVVLSDLCTLYERAVAGRSVDSELPAAPLFTDYAMQVRRAAHGADAQAAERYWVETLGTTPPVLDLPTDRPRPLERKLAARREDWVLDAEQAAELKRTAQKNGLSLAALLMAAWDAFLFRITGQVDFLLGVPFAGQVVAEQLGLVGHCVNTLPLRVQLDPERSFLEHARSMKSALIDASEYQQLSFGDLLQKLDIPRDPSRVPLIPVLFNVDQPMPGLCLGETQVRFRSNPRKYENFELFLNVTPTADGSLVVETTYNEALFERDTIVRWLGQYTELLRGVVGNVESELGRLPAISERERHWLLVELNRTEIELPEQATVLDRFEQQATRTPDAVAVRDRQTSLTYRELNQRANALAAQLAERGVDNTSRVGVCLPRTPDLLVSLLGIWKASASYVPLDPDYPTERLEFMLQDARVRLIVTEPELAKRLPGTNLENVFVTKETRAESPDRKLAPSDLAYTLHTSGSTGQPKGVEIEQRSLLNLLLGMARELDFTEREVLVAVTTLSFDIAGLELFLPLVSGSQVVLATRDETMEGEVLGRLLERTGATCLQATPATWRLLIDANWSGSPHLRALCGGEALPPDLAESLLPRVGALFNVYGPTETTIWSTIERITNPQPPIPIGRPLANTQLYVLDSNQELTLAGASGELYIGGAGVARGYLNRPELNRERFIRDPFSKDPSRRLYRTGDVVRYLRDGRLVFERRNDNQVKVRGFRIELGEIETALAKHLRVHSAACIVQDLGGADARLLAYVVPADIQAQNDSSLAKELHQFLRESLPPYMVPQSITVLAEFPLTLNGKLDRKALATQKAAAPALTDFVAPHTDTQRRLSEIWVQLLRVPQVGLTSSFFELGGHSLLAVRMIAKVRQELKADVPLRAVFQAQTLEHFADHVETALLVQQGKTRRAPNTEAFEEIDF